MDVMTAETLVRRGEDSLRELAADLRSIGTQRVLLVTGRSSFERSGAVQILDMLKGYADVLRWEDFAPNVNALDLQRGLGIMRSFACDTVVGVGGGSVMDMAKLLSAYQDELSLDGLLSAIQSGDTIQERKVVLGLIPTTSGSGSEATHFAVVYINENKHSVAGPALLADVVALNPDLALSGSCGQRAASGLDAVCQAIESRWAVGATPRSRRYAEFALTLMLNNLEQFVADPTRSNSKAVQLGSHLSGRAINISKTTAAHALSYGITKRLGVQHGHAVALTLGEFISDHAEPNAPLQKSIDPLEHKAAMAFILEMLNAADGHAARAEFYSLLGRVGLSSLAALGIGPAEVEELAVSVNTERLVNNPVVYRTTNLIDLLERATKDSIPAA